MERFPHFQFLHCSAIILVELCSNLLSFFLNMERAMITTFNVLLLINKLEKQSKVAWCQQLHQMT